MTRFLLAAGAALALVTTAIAGDPPAHVAQSAPSKPAAAATAAKDDPNPMICARVETTGSRLPEKECHLASYWQARREQGRDDLANRDKRQMSGLCAYAPC